MRYVDKRTVACIEEMDAYLEREYSTLGDAIEEQPTPPCEDRGDKRACEHKAMCGLNELACPAFVMYVREPSHRLEVVDWSKVSRLPSRKMYLMVHKDYT